MSCEEEIISSIIYGLFSFSWGVFGLWWVMNTYCKNRRYTKSLQRIMTFVVLFKFLNVGFYACWSANCDNETARSYWGLAVTSTYTIFNTFIYTSLILISKGFCITRDLLDRSEITVIAMTMGVVYLAYSAYIINPNSLYILLAMILAMLFYMTAKYTNACLKALRTRYTDLQNSNIEAMLASVRSKISLFKSFRLLVFFYLAEQIFFIIVLYLLIGAFLQSIDLYFIVVGLVGELFETFVMMTVFVLFRSKDRGQFSTIEQIGPRMEVQPVAPLLSAKVPFGYDIELNQLAPNTPAIVYTPQEFNRENPYRGVLIAHRLRHGNPEETLNIRN